MCAERLEEIWLPAPAERVVLRLYEAPTLRMEIQGPADLAERWITVVARRDATGVVEARWSAQRARSVFNVALIELNGYKRMSGSVMAIHAYVQGRLSAHFSIANCDWGMRTYPIALERHDSDFGSLVVQTMDDQLQQILRTGTFGLAMVDKANDTSLVSLRFRVLENPSVFRCADVPAPFRYWLPQFNNAKPRLFHLNPGEEVRVDITMTD